jgi:hypothetical protein
VRRLRVAGFGVKGKKRKSLPLSIDFFIVLVFQFIIFCSLFILGFFVSRNKIRVRLEMNVV